MKLPFFNKPNIDAAERYDLEVCLISDNIRRGSLLAYIIITFESICVISDIITALLKVDARFAFYEYLLMYAIMIVLNLTFVLMTKEFRSKPESIRDNKGKIEAIIIIYVTLAMSWGSVVSLMDQRLYGQLMAFMVNMITSSVIFLLSTKKLVIPFVISSAILVVGLPVFQFSKDILIGHYVNLTMFIILSWIASRIIYHYYTEYYISNRLLTGTNKLLEAKNEEIKRVNKKLALANNKLKELALLDELTGISNRRSFREFIDREFNSCMSRGSDEPKCTMSVIMLDIDYFKQYNDRYGHDEGDRVLTAVANEISSVVEDTSEIAVRWGGEEFIYAAFNKRSEDVQKAAETIRSRVAGLNIKNEDSPSLPYITVSSGVCTVEINVKADVTAVIKIADNALYLAKKGGRNKIVTLSSKDAALADSQSV